MLSDVRAIISEQLGTEVEKVREPRTAAPAALPAVIRMVALLDASNRIDVYGSTTELSITVHGFTPGM